MLINSKPSESGRLAFPVKTCGLISICKYMGFYWYLDELPPKKLLQGDEQNKGSLSIWNKKNAK